MNKIEKIVENSKKVLKTIGLSYLAIGSLCGFTDYISGLSTGHLSSDIVCGLKNPTYLEKVVSKEICNSFELDTPYWAIKGN